MDLLGPAVVVLPCTRFEDLFVALRDSQVDAAVVPIENTLHGSVHENYDHLLHYDFRIVAETNVRIVHNLIAAPGVRFKDLKRVFSHPVALNQCLDFFAANPQIQREPFYDTAGSVKIVVHENLRDAAAIASAVSAESTARESSSVPSRTTARTLLGFSSSAAPTSPRWLSTSS